LDSVRQLLLSGSDHRQVMTLILLDEEEDFPLAAVAPLALLLNLEEEVFHLLVLLLAVDQPLVTEQVGQLLLVE